MDLPGINQYEARINVLAQEHKAMKPVRLEPAAPRSQAKHSITELHDLGPYCLQYRLPNNISRQEEQTTKVVTGETRFKPLSMLT